jgi:hypothetical protein
MPRFGIQVGRTNVARRTDRTEDGRRQVVRLGGESEWHGTWQDESPATSLATMLERNHGFTSRVARWLFIEGWMGVFLIVGLMLLGLIMGLLRR